MVDRGLRIAHELLHGRLLSIVTQHGLHEATVRSTNFKFQNSAIFHDLKIQYQFRMVIITKREIHSCSYTFYPFICPRNFTRNLIQNSNNVFS